MIIVRTILKVEFDEDKLCSILDVLKSKDTNYMQTNARIDARKYTIAVSYPIIHNPDTYNQIYTFNNNRFVIYIHDDSFYEK